MDDFDRCDQHGRSLDHPWGCFGCSMEEYLRENSRNWEPRFPVLTIFPEDRVKVPYKVFVEGGHAFEVDEKGNLKWWEHDVHDGYSCALCYEAFCRNCEPDWQTQKCPDNQNTLPGFELEVNSASPGNGK
ncbi:hypothetical protein SEA_TIEDYE_65 [Streptomyces phage TieDye]|nr:hypothetical protein SEA_TIEDYE_65 [Streptomyces phage TieDye]QWY81468.1 hypothetical protein PET_TAIDAONE_70 [Streptomyces phage TaidaOne]